MLLLRVSKRDDWSNVNHKSRDELTAEHLRNMDGHDREVARAEPPRKRIKRPAVTLDEDEYTKGISRIIRRDFFPSLQDMDTDNELQSAPGGEIFGLTSTELAEQEEDQTKKTSLNAFLSKFTSEDNASFNELLDHQNGCRREAYSFVYNGKNRIEKARELAQIESPRSEKTIERKDDRPPVLDTWTYKPLNNMLFAPETIDPAMGDEDKKTIAYSNTRLHNRPKPASPASQRGIYGDGSETPRVAGYPFVVPEPVEAPHSASKESIPHAFKFADAPRRALLTQQMAERRRKAAPTPKLQTGEGHLTPAARALLGKMTPTPQRGKEAIFSTPLVNATSKKDSTPNVNR